MNLFSRADILLPKTEEMDRWAVIACDQFTSDVEYWERVKAKAGDAVSAFHLILPEAELGTPAESEHTAGINACMRRYVEEDVFAEYKNSYIYLERTLVDGSIRRGLVGKVDLDAYEFTPDSSAPVRASERTVPERIPPRKRVRKDATLELPHVLMLCDDQEQRLVEPVAAGASGFRKLYDFDLMEEGGHIRGWLVSEEAAGAFDAALTAYIAEIGSKYADIPKPPVVFVVGDGNHSLATAKTCWEELKAAHPGEDLSNHPARYALVELENIHDPSLKFEPIHRVVFDTDTMALLEALKQDYCAESGFPVTWYTAEGEGKLFLDPKRSQLAVGVLQAFLNTYMKDHEGTIDYIHDDDALIGFSRRPGAIGFLIPGIEKSQLFRGVVGDGVLPRKTFSMGHSREKRYYLEARKIK